MDLKEELTGLVMDRLDVGDKGERGIKDDFWMRGEIMHWDGEDPSHKDHTRCHVPWYRSLETVGMFSSPREIKFSLLDLCLSVSSKCVYTHIYTHICTYTWTYVNIYVLIRFLKFKASFKSCQQSFEEQRGRVVIVVPINKQGSWWQMRWKVFWRSHSKQSRGPGFPSGLPAVPHALCLSSGACGHPESTVLSVTTSSDEVRVGVLLPHRCHFLFAHPTTGAILIIHKMWLIKPKDC